MQRMVFKSSPQPVDRVKCGRCHMIEGAPVVGDKIPRLQSLEERQRITTCQVSFTKTWLPPWRVADREKRQIQASAFFHQVLFHQMRCVRSKSSITSKEAGYFVSIYEIHIRCAS